MTLRSNSTTTNPITLTPTMIKAIVCRPLSLTLVWNTIEIKAEDAIEPRYPNVRNKPDAVPIWSAATWEYSVVWLA